MYRSMYWKAFKVALSEEPVVKPVGLAEALKIRVISKGPPVTYFVLKSFQEFLWKRLKSFPVFSLIGRPIEVDDIERIIGDPTGCTIVSGDYKASTDNLHPWVSEVLLEELGKVLGESDYISPDLLALAKRALTGHIFEDRDGKRSPQRMGQLMGSIISFPFLCLANAALCRMALEIAEDSTRTVSLLDLHRLSFGRLTELSLKSNQIPLLVNGDDCVLASRCSRLGEIWEAITKIAGLSSSVGKTYVVGPGSKRYFAVMNSCHYDWDGLHWVLRSYVNMGLVKGLGRTGGGETDSGRPIEQLGDAHQKLYETAPRDLWGTVNRLFFYYNTNELKKYRGSWFFPKWLGGLGLVKTGEYTNQELRQVSALKILISQGLGPELIPSTPEWDMHRVALKRQSELFPLLKAEYPYRRGSAGIERLEFDLEEQNEIFYKYCVIESLFYNDEIALFPGGKRAQLVEINKRRKKEREERKKGKRLAKKVLNTPARNLKRIIDWNTLVHQTSLQMVLEDQQGFIKPVDASEVTPQKIQTYLPILCQNLI